MSNDDYAKIAQIISDNQDHENRIARLERKMYAAIILASVFGFATFGGGIVAKVAFDKLNSLRSEIGTASQEVKTVSKSVEILQTQVDETVANIEEKSEEFGDLVEGSTKSATEKIDGHVEILIRTLDDHIKKLELTTERKVDRWVEQSVTREFSNIKKAIEKLREMMVVHTPEGRVEIIGDLEIVGNLLLRNDQSAGVIFGGGKIKRTIDLIRPGGGGIKHKLLSLDLNRDYPGQFGLLNFFCISRHNFDFVAQGARPFFSFKDGTTPRQGPKNQFEAHQGMLKFNRDARSLEFVLRNANDPICLLELWSN